MHLPFPRSVILIAFTLPLLFSCNTSKNEDLIILMNSSIDQSNNMIHGQTVDLLHSLEEKLNDSATGGKARYWYPKAEFIHRASVEMIDFLKSTNSNSINTDSLITKMEIYKDNILRSDGKVNEVFKNSFDKLFPKRAILKSVLKNKDSIHVNAITNGLKNTVRIAEARALMFCYEQCPRNIFEFTITSAIIVQNSSVVKKGMPIEITAGIGEFSTKNQAVIKISNKQVPLSQKGPAVYQFKSPQKAGNYSVPVEIEYIDQDGRKLNLNKTITYTVVE